MRWLIPFALVIGGCLASIPGDPRISADLACETARAIVQMRAAPDATPEDDTPRPGDKCPPCNGTGQLPTDGRVVIRCEQCAGTGKVLASVCVEGCE